METVICDGFSFEFGFLVICVDYYAYYTEICAKRGNRACDWLQYEAFCQGGDQERQNC
jgi:hypothetical protein